MRALVSMALMATGVVLRASAFAADAAAVTDAATPATIAATPTPPGSAPVTAASGGVPTPSPTHALFEATSRHPFDDVAQWSAVFDDPARDAWQKPKELVAALDLRPGMIVADLGAGTGYFSRYLSAAVGDAGTVLAIDTEPNLVAHLRARAEREGTANVTPVLASFDDPRLPRAAIDLVLIVDTYHHLDQRLAYLTRLKRALNRGGRVAVVDWQARELPVGPPLEHKLARDQVVREMEAAGYRLVAEPPVLPFQYVLVFAAT